MRDYSGFMAADLSLLSWINCPVLSFPQLFTRGSKYKALNSLPHSEDRSWWKHKHPLFALVHSISSSAHIQTPSNENCANDISNSVYYRKSLLILYFPPVAIASSIRQIVHTGRLRHFENFSFWMKNIHKWQRGEQGSLRSAAAECLCLPEMILQRKCGSILHAGIFLISWLSRVCLSDVVMRLISGDGLMNHKKTR